MERIRTKGASKERQANLELLRILSMMMVIMMHLLNHGRILEQMLPGTPSYYLVWSLEGLSFVSINCYVLISGYFLVDSSVSFMKLFKLEGQVWFYSIGLYALALMTRCVTFEPSDFIYALFPAASCEYWFVTMYMGMYLLAPFVNKLLKSLTQKQCRLFVIVLFALFSLIPNLFFYSAWLNFGGGAGIVWFISVYCMGAYVKMYYSPDGRTRRHFLRYLAAAMLVPLSRFAIEALLKTGLGKVSFFETLMWGFSVFFNYNSVLVTAASLLLFIAFLNLKIRPGRISKAITVLAAGAFGVYLAHDNPNIREPLWGKLSTASLPERWYLIPALLGIMVLVYLAGTLIDFIRRLIFERLGRCKALASLSAKLDEMVFRNNGF